MKKKLKKIIPKKISNSNSLTQLQGKCRWKKNHSPSWPTPLEKDKNKRKEVKI